MKFYAIHITFTESCLFPVLGLRRGGYDRIFEKQKDQTLLSLNELTCFISCLVSDLFCPLNWGNFKRLFGQSVTRDSKSGDILHHLFLISSCLGVSHYRRNED